MPTPDGRPSVHIGPGTVLNQPREPGQPSINAQFPTAPGQPQEQPSPWGGGNMPDWYRDMSQYNPSQGGYGLRDQNAQASINADATNGQLTPPAYGGTPISTNWGPNGNDPRLVMPGQQGQQQQGGSSFGGGLPPWAGSGLHGFGQPQWPGGQPGFGQPGFNPQQLQGWGGQFGGMGGSGPTGSPTNPDPSGRFLPPIFTNPMTNQTNVSGNLQSYGMSGIPDATTFQNGMYGGNQRDMYQGAFSPNAQNFQQGAWGPGAQQFQQGAFSQGVSNFQQGAFSPLAQNFQQGAFSPGAQMFHQNAFSPQAMAYQNSLYAPGLNAMEQNFMGSGSALGRLGLEDAFNRVDDQFESTPMASAKPKAYADAANQFALQMMNTGSQMGLQREQLANQNLAQAYGTLGHSFDTLGQSYNQLNNSYGTLNQGYGQLNNMYGLLGQGIQNIPQMFNQPLQAGQAGQQAAGNLLNMFQQGMYGDSQFPLSLFNSWPIQSPTYIQPPAGGGGGGGGK